MKKKKQQQKLPFVFVSTTGSKSVRKHSSALTRFACNVCSASNESCAAWSGATYWFAKRAKTANEPAWSGAQADDREPSEPARVRSTTIAVFAASSTVAAWLSTVASGFPTVRTLSEVWKFRGVCTRWSGSSHPGAVHHVPEEWRVQPATWHSQTYVQCSHAKTYDSRLRSATDTWSLQQSASYAFSSTKFPIPQAGWPTWRNI